MDIEAREVEEIDIPEDEEALIQHIVDNKLINKAGGLFKCGIQIANCRVVMEASRRVAANDAAEKVKKVQKVQKKEESATLTAIVAYSKWQSSGKPTDTNGHPKLAKADAKAMVKVLLPRIAPNEKLSSYESMKKCNQWLGEVAGGTTWATEMEQVEKENWHGATVATTVRLF